MKEQFGNYNDKSKYTVSIILRVGPYIYTELFRLTCDELKGKIDSWIRNGHELLRISITLDGKEYFRVKDYEDLCWVIKHKDDPLFEYTKDYRLRA